MTPEAMERDKSAPPPCRVLWLFRNFYPELAGGAERFRRYAPGLQSRGVEVEVLTASAQSQEVAEPKVPKVMRIPRPQILPAQIDHLLVKQALRLMSDGGYPYQAVQVGVVHWADVPYFLWMKCHGVKIILICTIIHVADEPEISWWRQAFRWLTGVVTHRVCDAVIVSSSCMAENRIQEGALQQHIKIVCNGVDTQRFRPRTAEEKQALRDRLGIPAKAPVLLYMGGVVPRKRAHLLIAALHELRKTHPDTRLYLIGPTLRPTMFHAADQDELLAYQSGLYEMAGPDLNEHIFFMGESQEPEIWFSVADVFAFCPVNEGFGNVIIEAMSSGTPVVMTPFVGLAEELGTAGKHYLLAESTGSALATACQALFDDACCRESLVTAALEWVLKRHARDITLDQLADVYRAGSPQQTI